MCQTRSGWWFEPLWKIWKSIGMIIPHIWENKKWQPNHQPEMGLFDLDQDHQHPFHRPTERTVTRIQSNSIGVVYMYANLKTIKQHIVFNINPYTIQRDDNSKGNNSIWFCFTHTWNKKNEVLTIDPGKSPHWEKNISLVPWVVVPIYIYKYWWLFPHHPIEVHPTALTRRLIHQG